MAKTENVRFQAKPGATARFECACGENITIKVGEVDVGWTRPICKCGRAWLVTFEPGPATWDRKVMVNAEIDDSL